MKKTRILEILLFFSLFLLFLLPPTDPDLGWHLRCGQEFWQNNTFCNFNQFSVLLPNYSWPNHYWLYQAIIFPVFKFSGLWGLTFFNALLMSLSFFLFYKSLSKKDPVFALFSTLLTIILGWGVFNLGIRSQLTSFFFFSCLLFLISKARQNPAIAGFCPLIILLWSNMHGGSVIFGIYLLLFFFLFSLVRHCGRPERAWQSQARLSRLSGIPPDGGDFALLAITIASLLATFINPFGLAIYQDAFRHFNGPIDLSKIIAEWVPPSPIVQFLIIVTTIIFFVFLIFSKKKKGLIFFFLTLPLVFLAFKARRNVPFYFLFFFYALGESGISKKWPVKKDFNDALNLSLIIFLLLMAPFINLPSSLITNSSFKSYAQNSPIIYPLKAIEFLKKQPDKGNIFNRYEWGGFLIWQLPQFKIFVDGRMPAWLARRSLGEDGTVSPYTIYLETLQNQPGWQKTLADYKIDWILIGPNTFMDLLLREDPVKFGWQEVYRDQVGVIFKKL